MVGYDEALALALGCWDEVDYYEETENAFIFSKKDDFSFGGSQPVVVMKDDGRCVSMPQYLGDGLSTPTIREGAI